VSVLIVALQDKHRGFAAGDKRWLNPAKSFPKLELIPIITKQRGASRERGHIVGGFEQRCEPYRAIGFIDAVRAVDRHS
jgi:hypothetical protein